MKTKTRIKKFLFMGFSAVLLLSVLFGCAGGPSENPGGNTGSTNPPSGTEQTEAPVLGSFSASDLDVVIDGHTIKLASDEEALAALGEADSVDVADSCLFDGYDKTYHYSFGDIFTYPSASAGVNIIDEIYITGTGCTLKGGIDIGSTRAEVEEVYGTAYYTDGDDMIVYNVQNDPAKNEELPKLYFVFENDVTVGIGFCANTYHPEG